MFTFVENLKIESSKVIKVTIKLEYLIIRTIIVDFFLFRRQDMKFSILL